MFKVFTRFKREKNIKSSPVGRKIVPLFEYRKDDKGLFKKVIVGETNLYQFIQENAKNCSLTMLISQLKKGDFSSLDSSKGVYLDDSQLPKDLNELHSFNKKVVDIYSKNKVLKHLYKTKDDYIKAVLDNKVYSDVQAFKSKVDKTIISKLKDKQANNKIVKDDIKVKEEVKKEI